MYRIKIIIIHSVVISFLCFGFKVFAQTNRYFQNNECWSVIHDEFSGVWYKYYVCTNGDSIIGSDTLVKFVLYGDEFFTFSYVQIIGSPTIPSFLAKENNRILTIYPMNAGNIVDTVTVDYNRTDSLVWYTASTNSNVGLAIMDTSSFSYNGTEKEIDTIYNGVNPVYSYEGIFDKYGNPFIDYHMPSQLECFSSLDSIYYSPQLFFDYTFHLPPLSGNCIIPNVGLQEEGNKIVSVIPNPAIGEIIIESYGQLLPTAISILDMLGNEVVIMNWSSNNFGEVKVNIQDLRSGQYIIRVSYDNASYGFKRFIKL